MTKEVDRSSLDLPYTGTNITRRALSLILIAAAIGVTPMLLFGYHLGHDLSFHVSSWMEAEQQFRQGNLFPSWAPGANYGFGDARFIFYPPISWVTGAALGSILPWKMVPGTYVFLAFVLAGVAMWKLAIEWLAPPNALLASVLYALSPYSMVTAYTRCAYGELMAGALLPLLGWAALRMARDPRRAVIPLAVVFAAIWLANLPAAVIASYSLACLLLLDCLVSWSLRPLWFGAAAILAGFGVAAFTLLPAALERKWTNAALISNYKPWNDFLFARRSTPLIQNFHVKLSFMALILIGITLIAAFFARGLRQNTPEVWWPLTALGAVAAFLMSPLSRIVWQTLPELRFVQLPWRWLFPLCMAGAFLTASAVPEAGRKWISWLALILVVGAIYGRIAHWDSFSFKDALAAVRSGAGYGGTREYAPFGIIVGNLPKDAPQIALAKGLDEKDSPSRPCADFHVDLWTPERKVIYVNSPESLSVNLKLLAYPSWRVKVNGIAVNLEADENTGQVRLRLPAGKSRTEIAFVRTWDRTAGIAISFASVIAIVAGGIFVRREGVSQNAEA